MKVHVVFSLNVTGSFADDIIRVVRVASMTSTFQCEYCQCFTFKRCDNFKLKCTSHGGMYCPH